MPRLSDEQRTDRRKGIGASDVAEFLGISPYEGASPVRLFAEKIGILLDDSEETIEQRVGHAFEGPMVRLYEEESGRRAIISGEYVETVVHPEHAWARCNLDGRIVGARIGLEIKIVGIGMAHDWDTSSDDGIPHYVRTQVAWQCFVADLDEVHVIALIGGTNFRVYYVARDRELEAILELAGRAFWEGVLARKAPALDASSGAKLYLEALYPGRGVDVEAECPEALIPIGERRIKMADLEARAGEAKEICNNQIREAMGLLGATRVRCPTWYATWRANKNGARSLLVKPSGDLKQPKVRTPKPNADRPPVIEDGEVF